MFYAFILEDTLRFGVIDEDAAIRFVKAIENR